MVADFLKNSDFSSREFFKNSEKFSYQNSEFCQNSQRADAILIFTQVIEIVALQILCGIFEHFKSVRKDFTPLWLALWLVPMRKGLCKYELSMLSPYNISMNHAHVLKFL